MRTNESQEPWTITRSMKIAYVVHDFNNRLGHSRYVYELCRRFAPEHEIHVFTNRVEGGRPAGIQFHHVPAIRTRALSSILTFILPATVLVRGDFDIIHAQGLCGLRQNVVTAHMCLEAWYEAVRRQNGYLTWKQKLSRSLVVPLERWTFQPGRSRRVIAVSQRIRRDLEQYYGRREGVSVIYHGVDLDRFHPDNRARYRSQVRGELGIDENIVLALYVGDLQKGATASIRAVKRTAGTCLVCVSASRAEIYRQVVEAEKIANRCIFVPATDQIERYYGAADVFVFPTCYDPFGMVISEAMASGLPVLTTRTAGAAELIEPGVSGLLVDDPNDVETLACQLQRLAGDREWARKLGATARLQIELYSWDRAARATMAVYRELCRNGSR
jgi:UDP-glucose:(heptosyl)LPS alpha-1,3-glucosyltransferase